MEQRWGLPLIAWPSRLRPNAWYLVALPLVLGLVALVAWLRVPETREARGHPGGSVRPATLPGFVHQLRMLSGHTGFLLVSLIGLSAEPAPRASP